MRHAVRGALGSASRSATLRPWAMKLEQAAISAVVLPDPPLKEPKVMICIAASVVTGRHDPAVRAVPGASMDPAHQGAASRRHACLIDLWGEAAVLRADRGAMDWCNRLPMRSCPHGMVS